MMEFVGPLNLVSLERALASKTLASRGSNL